MALDMVDKRNWWPTREELKAYRLKEIEMCIAARRAQPRLQQNQTLFSVATWNTATLKLERIKREMAQHA